MEENMVMKYVLYDSDTNTVLEVKDTESEIKEAYKLAKIARKMVHEKPLQMSKALLTEEEIKEFNREGAIRWVK